MAEVRTQVDISCARCGSSLGVAFSGKVVKEHYSLQVYPCMKCSPPKSDGERNDSALVDFRNYLLYQLHNKKRDVSDIIDAFDKISSLPFGEHNTERFQPVKLAKTISGTLKEIPLMNDYYKGVLK